MITFETHPALLSLLMIPVVLVVWPVIHWAISRSYGWWLRRNGFHEGDHIAFMVTVGIWALGLISAMK